MTPWAVKLLAFLAVLLATYILECLVWPYKRCRRCSGSGRRHEWWGIDAWRLCGRCDGTGRRPRIGRRLWNLRKGS